MKSWICLITLRGYVSIDVHSPSTNDTLFRQSCWLHICTNLRVCSECKGKDIYARPNRVKKYQSCMCCIRKRWKLNLVFLERYYKTTLFLLLFPKMVILVHQCIIIPYLSNTACRIIGSRLKIDPPPLFIVEYLFWIPRYNMFVELLFLWLDRDSNVKMGWFNYRWCWYSSISAGMGYSNLGLGLCGFRHFWYGWFWGHVPCLISYCELDAGSIGRLI